MNTVPHTTQDSSPPSGPVKAVSLLSGGLDSILATRVVQDQGVDVLALHFITPFFGDDKRGREAEIEAAYRERYGIRLRIVDVSREYLDVLASPRYGYGKNFNPCVDCKIFLIRKAVEILHQEGARFLVTGEVLGQRPMSQRRDAMNAIAKQTGAREILLRPLSAKLLPPTAPERHGWVDRNLLFDFSGRNRKPQMELAARLGITEYPTPAGGCRLTDPTLGQRVRRYFEAIPAAERDPDDLRLLLTGRPFRFPGGSLFTLGRSRGENEVVARLFVPGDAFAHTADVPGPLGLFRARGEADERTLAAAVLLRYTPKAPPGTPVGFGPDREHLGDAVSPAPVGAQDLETWRL
ncbi:MAG: thiamine biosynthesis protein [Thermodesulfobacteriota bacterium]